MEQIEKKHQNIFSRQVRAGKRTYYFDVKATKSGDDFFVIISESRRLDDQKKEKQKIFLYKEDFSKFIDALTLTLNHVEKKLVSKAEPIMEILD
jgi:hypothetical protein